MALQDTQWSGQAGPDSARREGAGEPIAGLTVVVPFVNSAADLADCLRALSEQTGGVDLEVLVVDRVGRDLSTPVVSRYPGVVVIPVQPATTIPEMRATAMARATRDAVAVIEDHVIVPPGWATAMLEALRRAEVVGGSVENAATTTWVDWAAFLCEYSHCLPPIPAGSVSWLTGNNVVYRRRLLEQHRAVVESGRWENYLHDTIRDSGTELICCPEIVVGHKKHYTLLEYLSQRYLYARSYAGARVAGAGPLRRLAIGLAALALPPLLLYRTIRRVLAKRKHVGLLARSLPLIGLFVLAWAWGEVVGYLLGPGDSLSRVC